MGTTANRAYRYPASTDVVRPYEHIQNLANDVDADMQGLLNKSGTMDVVRATAAGALAITATDPTELTTFRSASMQFVNGNLYRFHGQCLYTAVTDAWTLEIRKGGTSGTIVGGARFAVSAGNTLVWDVFWPCASTETTQFYYMANRLSGSGTLSVFAVNDGFNNTFAAVEKAGLSSLMRDVA